MSSRCNYIEQEEPQYKVFQNMLEPQQTTTGPTTATTTIRTTKGKKIVFSLK